MESLSTLKARNRQRAAQAARDDLKPYVYFSADEVDDSDTFPFPYFGDYRPDGWELTATRFVDSSGFGKPGEPALTAEEFRQVIRDEIHKHATDRELVGWAVIEAGWFQVRVGEFTRPA